jgi:hypothetical protein
MHGDARTHPQTHTSTDTQTYSCTYTTQRICKSCPTTAICFGITQFPWQKLLQYRKFALCTQCAIAWIIVPKDKQYVQSKWFLKRRASLLAPPMLTDVCGYTHKPGHAASPFVVTSPTEAWQFRAVFSLCRRVCQSPGTGGTMEPCAPPTHRVHRLCDLASHKVMALHFFLASEHTLKTVASVQLICHFSARILSSHLQVPSPAPSCLVSRH